MKIEQKLKSAIYKAIKGMGEIQLEMIRYAPIKSLDGRERMVLDNLNQSYAELFNLISELGDEITEMEMKI